MERLQSINKLKHEKYCPQSFVAAIYAFRCFRIFLIGYLFSVNAIRLSYRNIHAYAVNHFLYNFHANRWGH